MSSFIDNLKNAMNQTTTLNGANTNISTKNPLLDFFAMGGATRNNVELGLDLFKKAFAFDRQGTIRALFYLRDIRGGQGERKVFRMCIKYLVNTYPDILDSIINHIPEFGRYDDLVFLLDTPSIAEKILAYIKSQLYKDIESESPSLLAKWLPSENASSVNTQRLGTLIRRYLKISPKQYRKKLSCLRSKINIIEKHLTTKNYEVIDYSKLPSQASFKYRKAFKRNDSIRYDAFLNKVEKGEAKINTKTLYPYQIYDAVNKGTDSKVLDIMWNNLPDYTNGKNALVVADVSGSMSGFPMSISVSLALYFADKNKGQFKDYFITFSSNPQLQKINGKNVVEKMNSIERSNWSMDTNIKAVFETILNTAVANKTSQDEMPATLYIISDMEFNQCSEGDRTNFRYIDNLYASNGYKRPHLVFWNVDSKTKQVPVVESDNGVSLISGASTSTFSIAFEGKTPTDLMNEVINGERYSKILLQ